MMKRWIVLLFTFFICYGLPSDQDEKEKLAKLSRILLCTVVDPHNPTVVRDSLTLFRSIALYGKSLNHVTKVIGIPSINIQEGSSAVVPMDIVRELLRYKVQVVLFPTATPRHAGTMNKFNLLKALHIDEVDYIFWLDADTIILDDPIDQLPLHKMPGEISCVPEFYSYMRRYPAINTTESFWNPSLPVFTLIGDHEVAPHGMCNTGVLYFDRYSLRKILDIFDDAMSKIPLIYHRDRFFDSLIFVYGINMLAISVNILPYSLNYMAFFEGEILQLTQTDTPMIAHLLSDTEFFCHMPSKESTCDCFYNNEYILPDSALVPALEKFLAPETCHFMATGRSSVEAQEETNEAKETALCTLLWPPNNFVCPGIRRIEVVLQCSADVHVSISAKYGMAVDSQSTVYDGSILTSALYHSIMIDLSKIFYGLNDTQTSVQLYYDINSVDNRRTIFNTSVVIPNLKTTARGRMIYGYQPIFGSKPISLESQMEFSEYLSFYFKPHALSGIILCCDSTKGVLAVTNLLESIEREQHTISTSEHSNLLNHVLVRRLPDGYEDISLVDFVNSYLKQKCPHRCIFWIAELVSDWPNVVNALPDLTFDFALIDSYDDNYDQNKDIFQVTLKKLKRGGIILGTNYILQNRKMGELITTSSNTMRMNAASYSILALSWEMQHVLLFTYLERDDGFCGSLGFGISLDNCFPAWYLHKSITL